MRIVLDTSAAVEVLLKGVQSPQYAAIMAKADLILAPEIFYSEITNVAWKYHKLGGYTPGQSDDLAENGIGLIDLYIPTREIWKEALREAINNDHPAYDCLYLVCARRHDAVLLTKDKKLKKLCQELKITVK